MLQLVALLAVMAPQDDLHDQLHSRLEKMNQRAQDSFFHVLERVPDKKRRDAAKRFLKSGWKAFEKNHHRKSCCVKKWESKIKTRIRKRVLKELEGEWDHMSDGEKKAWVNFMLKVYMGMPKESRQKVAKAIQAEIFKSFGSKKKKKKK